MSPVQYLIDKNPLKNAKTSAIAAISDLWKLVPWGWVRVARMG